MPEYCLPIENVADWNDLDSFVQGYIEALFFTETEPGTSREDRMTTRGTVRQKWARAVEEGQHHDMPGDYGPSDLAPCALERIKADCAAFQMTAAWLAFAAWRDAGGDDSGTGEPADDEQAGRDLWFTRNGHGVGFWCRDAHHYGPHQDALSSACGWRTAFGECDVYVGDDGKVYLS
ncbi:MAG: hypothetical protein O9972_39655 [Burkholderiales bacterium]|nr:hypothetical protein [Burkholderiales bacterium]